MGPMTREEYIHAKARRSPSTVTCAPIFTARMPPAGGSDPKSSIFRASTGHLAERIAECAHSLQPSARQKQTSGEHGGRFHRGVAVDSRRVVVVVAVVVTEGFGERREERVRDARPRTSNSVLVGRHRREIFLVVPHDV